MTKRVLEIAQVVAVNFGVTVPEIMSPCRTDRIAWARQVAYWITYKRAHLTMKQTAAAFNRRDHTTVSYAIRSIDNHRDADADFAKELEKLADDACLAFYHREGRRAAGCALVEVEVSAA